MTSCANVSLIRGNNYPPLQWQFLVTSDPPLLMDISGSVFFLSIDGPGISFIVSTNDQLAIDVNQAILSWPYTVAQSRLFPLGRVTSYEIERRVGTTQQVLAAGMICAGDGLNPD
jgi:hypothetical protein